MFGKDTQPTIAGKDYEMFDGQDKEVVMLLKLSMIDEMLHEVQIEKTSTAIWKHLKNLHETSDKGPTFFLKNMMFSITMS